MESNEININQVPDLLPLHWKWGGGFVFHYLCWRSEEMWCFIHRQIFLANLLKVSGIL